MPSWARRWTAQLTWRRCAAARRGCAARLHTNATDMNPRYFTLARCADKAFFKRVAADLFEVLLARASDFEHLSRRKVGAALFELAADESTLQQNRARLYKLRKRFTQAADEAQEEELEEEAGQDDSDEDSDDGEEDEEDDEEEEDDYEDDTDEDDDEKEEEVEELALEEEAEEDEDGSWDEEADEEAEDDDSEMEVGVWVGGAGG